MSKIEKVKRMFLIALGFGLATYLIMSGMAMLDKENENNTTKELKVKQNS
ncbi:MAG: hypothetical protein U9N02_04735 [Campylobacterota bacterium]|nr:hypothetical protein [Campylobacterota bacterium]